jgi:hypothetical protein
MTCSSRSRPLAPARASLHPALAVGPGAAAALASPGPLKVHSSFPSTLNLEVAGSGCLVALCGPAGVVYPHAIALAAEPDFRNWPVTAGDLGRCTGERITLQGRRGSVVIDLRLAQRPLAAPLPRIAGPGDAHLACMVQLLEIQEQAHHPLRLGAWPGAEGAMGAALAAAAADLGEAVRAFRQATGPAAGAGARLERAVTGLLGLGGGLTPAGDDFLSGFLAAAACSGPAADLRQALEQCLERNAWRTGSISAALLAWARRQYWPTPLVELAEALAADRVVEALAALHRLCQLGHSSGADLATGFLYGLAVLAADPARQGSAGSANRSGPPQPPSR